MPEAMETQTTATRPSHWLEQKKKIKEKEFLGKFTLLRLKS